MPQIWMTYDELATLLGCETDEARIQVVERSLDRKKSRDGLTRAKLDVHWMAKFFAAVRDADAVLDQAIRELQMVHTDMNREGSGIAGLNPMARSSVRRRNGVGQSQRG
jgi:hypothetical protein